MNQAICLLDKMSPHLIRSGITRKQLQKLRSYFEVWGESIILEFLAILRSVEVHEFQFVIDVWSLVPEDQWEQYVVLGIEELREQLLLSSAQKSLKQVFKERVLANVKKTREKARAKIDSGDATGVGI